MHSLLFLLPVNWLLRTIFTRAKGHFFVPHNGSCRLHLSPTNPHLSPFSRCWHSFMFSSRSRSTVGPQNSPSNLQQNWVRIVAKQDQNCGKISPVLWKTGLELWQLLKKLGQNFSKRESEVWQTYVRIVPVLGQNCGKIGPELWFVPI